MHFGPIRSEAGLGRRVPTDDKHIKKFPFAMVAPPTIARVEKTLALPRWHWSHDQGFEGSCVGHGTAMERAITNSAQARLIRAFHPGRRYDPLWQWNNAKMIDEWPDTMPGDDNGTSVRASYDVARTLGCRRIKASGIILGTDGAPLVTDQKHTPDPAEGVLVNRWATTVDEIRVAIANGIPVVIGVNWYTVFDRPYIQHSEWWLVPSGISAAESWGPIRGGHCICLYGASDRRQAFKIKNSWGKDYPLAWLSYEAMGRLLREDGEAALVTDR